MYYVSTDNKVYVKTSTGFREVKVTKDDNGLVTIDNLKEVAVIDIKCLCILEEIIARYLNVEEEKPQPKEEKEPKKSKISLLTSLVLISSLRGAGLD